MELVNNVVDSELLSSSTTERADNDVESDYVYEYVYYYYDEDGVNGTVVDTRPASSNVKQVLEQNVTAVDIHTNTGASPAPYPTFPYLHILFQGTRPPYMPGSQMIQRQRKRTPRNLKASLFLESPSPPFRSA